MKSPNRKEPKWYPGYGQVLAFSLALAMLFPVPLAAAIGLTLLVYKWIVTLANADSSAASRSRLSERGQSLTEYALVILLVSVLAAAALSGAGTAIANVMEEAASALQGSTISVTPTPESPEPPDGPGCSS